MAMLGKALARAQACRQAGEPQEALEILRKLLGKNARNKKVLFAFGDAADEANAWDDARDAYERLIALGEDGPAVKLRLAIAYWRLDRLYDAVPLLEAMLAEAPETLELWRLLGEVRMMHQDWDGAAEAWTKAAEVAPDHPHTALRLVAALHNAPRYAHLADVAAERAEALLKGDGRGLKELGDWYFYRHRYEEARRVFEAVLGCARDSELDLRFFRDLITLHRRTGSSDGVAQISDRAERFLASQGPVFQRTYPETVPREAAEAQLLYAAGDAGWREKLAEAYDAVRDVSLDYEAGAYLPDVDARLDRLRAIVRGRPVALLLPGPSIDALKPHLPRLAEADICFVCANKFDRLEAEFLQPLGLGADLVLLLARQEWHIRFSALEAFLQRSAPGQLVTVGPLLQLGSALGGYDFPARFDERIFTFSGRSSAPPMPADPLCLHYVNTIGAFLPLLALGGASEIAIFGADGGQTAGGEIYFHGGTALRPEDEAGLEAAAQAREKARYGDLLAAEAIHCNEHLPFVLEGFRLMHRFEPPRITIGTPESAYDFAERTGAGEAVSRLLAAADAGQRRPAA